ncbi:UDP-glucose 4-epimerase GalE [Johnsonella ignava]|uniref:UDP-glucose 4-epimerase GalE n=1 Tax=Johnsonella ignava TaxID=43995 RepID=UPI0023F014AD|nr:UDP-glucose 4-epimerase GalE [Johnsonella ignava]
MSILVTGGAGFIGSHTCVELLNSGYDVVVVDNLINSSHIALKRVEEITCKKIKFYKIDCLDKKALNNVFKNENIEAVIHFAGLKAVGESIYKPLEYYHNNITGTLILCDIMRRHKCKNIVFSSSATVYGDPAFVPITEECPMGHITNPYGRTKGMLEQILTDLHTADNEWNVMLLRYFNPIGAHESGKIGENPRGIPNNLLPYITQVAVGKLVCLGVFGNDYDTPGGTCIRDYIHVVDLAQGHVAALKKMMTQKNGVLIYNLGTGIGYSVLDVINAFEKANQLRINYVFKPRRAGDVPRCYADPSKAEKELDWKTTRDLETMCRDSWRWQKYNPDGFKEDENDIAIRKESGLKPYN